MLWPMFGAMLLAGALFVAWPMYGQLRRLTPGLALATVAVIAISAGFYTVLGSPATRSGAAAMPSVEQMVAALEQRLDSNPDDIAGWKMLGRSAMQLRDYDRAATAFGQAVEREDGNNAQTLADLGEAVLLQQGDSVSGRAAELFEAALAAAPNNPKALFYGGIAAIERNDRETAANRWETLLSLSPPEEVQNILRQRIAEWRAPSQQAPAADLQLNVDVTLANEARAGLTGDASIFVIARDPQQPSPPVAVARRKASELPATVTLSNADSMIPGRQLSQFRNLEIVVRASKTGNPIAQAGDWFGSLHLDTASTTAVSILIDQQVPVSP